MKASHKWLRELVPALPDDPALLARTFTNAGLEVEALHHFGAASASCLVVRVEGCAPHPHRSGLRLVTVSDGQGSRTVVCGAPNVPEAGGLVVLAPVGTVLPAVNLTLVPRAIGGITSEGMLCSARELGLGEDGDGILVFSQEFAAPGTKLSEAGPAFDDWIYEIAVTPNRPDALGHLGLARELCALLGLRLAVAEAVGAAPALSENERLAVRIAEPARCDHYAYALFAGATNGPSPLALRLRLQALGSRPISRIVDATNEALLLFGHPVHAFDRAKLSGDAIEVRTAGEGERILCLDGVERALALDDLVIADGSRAVALAGVMGSSASGCDLETAGIVLEVAVFDARSVRRTARRHGLHTDASHRFERGVDRSDTSAVRAWCIERIRELTGARLVGYGSEGVLERERNQAELRHERLELVAGATIAWPEAQEILERLGFDRLSGDSASAVFAIPWHRPD